MQILQHITTQKEAKYLKQSTAIIDLQICSPFTTEEVGGDWNED